MDAFLGKITQQAVNYAIRSGVTLTASYAISQSNRLLKSTPNSNAKAEVNALQLKLQQKVHILSPAIDMIELISARGNSSLASAVNLTKELRYQIQALGQRLEKAAIETEGLGLKGNKVTAAAREKHELELRVIAADIKQLLQRIEDAVPLINLAITTSGAKLSSQLPSTVSPSRLLQASTLLNTADGQYQHNPNRAVQVGPTFTLSVYMLFAGHNRPETEEEIRETTWKEVMHKARLKLCRVPLDVLLNTNPRSKAPSSGELVGSESGVDADNTHIPANARSDEFAYQLMVVEDLDDDRVHDFDNDDLKPGPFDDIALAGIREMIPIHEISKIFYADTSKVLNISPESEDHHPVLLLKRDLNAIPPRRMMQDDDIERTDDVDGNANGVDSSKAAAEAEKHSFDQHEDPWRFPPSLDPEWIAFEVYTEAEQSDTESESDTADRTNTLSSAVSKLQIESPQNAMSQSHSFQSLTTVSSPQWVRNVQTSLSLLELLLRLVSLQQFQQASHLSITDELLNFFLEESATTGAGGDEAHRQALRADARRRVGWDPYDESPLKRRGEDYQYQYDSPGRNGSHPGSYSREGSPFVSRPTASSADHSGIWSPPPGRGGQDGAQTRSMTGFSSDGGYSPSPSAKSRTDWIKRQQPANEGKQGSPLRQSIQDGSRRSIGKDEGLGTSPASASIPK